MLYNPNYPSEENMIRDQDRHYAWWRLYFTSESLGISCIGKTVEISMKGLSFHCPSDIPLSSKAKVTVYIPPCDFYPIPYEFNADARSVYSILQGESGFLIGLEFTNIHEDGATVLKIKLASCPLVPGTDDVISAEMGAKALAAPPE